MKKNLVLFAALMLTVVFGSAEIAKAADVQVGGQLFTRYEMNEHGSVHFEIKLILWVPKLGGFAPRPPRGSLGVLG